MLTFKALVLAAAASIMFSVAPSFAGSVCSDIHVEATNTAIDPMLLFGKYAGSAMISMDGQPSIPAAISLTPGELKVGDDGTVHLTSVLSFDLGPMGTLSVTDNAILVPTENPYVYTMNSRLDNLIGTGMFAGAFGKFSDHGQFSIMTATVTAHADGKICW